MTVREFVRENGCTDIGVYIQFDKFISNDLLEVDNYYTSWAWFAQLVEQGNLEKVARYKPAFEEAYNQARQSLKIFNKYTGEKKLVEIGQYNKHMYIEDGILKMRDTITSASLLKMSRLLRDAETRCKKHPSNANLGF